MEGRVHERSIPHRVWGRGRLLLQRRPQRPERLPISFALSWGRLPISPPTWRSAPRPWSTDQVVFFEIKGVLTTYPGCGVLVNLPHLIRTYLFDLIDVHMPLVSRLLADLLPHSEVQLFDPRGATFSILEVTLVSSVALSPTASFLGQLLRVSNALLVEALMVARRAISLHPAPSGVLPPAPLREVVEFSWKRDLAGLKADVLLSAFTRGAIKVYMSRAIPIRNVFQMSGGGNSQVGEALVLEGRVEGEGSGAEAMSGESSLV